MNGGCSPSSGRFLAQGTVAEAGGWVDMRSRSWTETLGGGKRTPAFPGGQQVQRMRCRRNGGDVLVDFSRKEETAGGAAELKPTDLGNDPSTCQELDKCRQAVLRCTA